MAQIAGAAIVAMVGVGMNALGQAEAVILASPGPSFPSTVVVGQVFPAGLFIANNSTLPDTTTPLVLSAIDLYPACPTTVPGCGGGAEAGVFTLSGTGAGSGASSCNGSWAITPDTATPATATRYRFVPPGGEGSLTLSAGESCTVNYTVLTRRVPTTDVSGGVLGTQTNQVATTSVQASGGLSFQSTGADATTVARAAPAVTHLASQSGISLPGTTTDTVTLGGPPPPSSTNGVTPAGTITFTLHAPSDTNCAGDAVATQAVPVNGFGSYTTSPPVPITSAGTYRWIAAYSGDANYQGSSTTCSDLAGAVTFPQALPSISTSATASVTIGGSISDTATVAVPSGPVPAATGSVIFTAFPTADCSGPAAFTSGARPLSATPPYIASSGPFTPITAGSYRWVAVYGGDPNYNGATSPCGASNETSVVERAIPTLSTAASPGGVLGTPVRDVATLNGGAAPTGTVTFRLFSDNTCATQVFTSTVALIGANATSGWHTPTAAGTYWWRATYDGDTNNQMVMGACLAPDESVTIGPFSAPAPTRTITGDLLGPVTVNAGESVLITSARVVGPVTVNPGGALDVVNSQIARGVVANAPTFFSMCGTKVSGPSPAIALSVTNAPVPVRVGDPATACAGNQFAGQVTLTGNLGVTFGANVVSHSVTANTNGPASVVIKANTILGTLACAGNDPAPSNAGQPNSAGLKTGQCTGV